MKSAGMSLIELLVGLAVAAIVAVIAIANLSMMGMVVVRQRTAARADDEMWMAHAAITRDLRSSTLWKGCIEARGCSVQRSHTGTPVLMLDSAEWLADDGLWRCVRNKPCDKFLENIVGVEFMADIRNDAGVTRRKPFAEAHTNAAKTLEVVLWTREGRSYSRTTGGHERRTAESTEHAP